MANLSLIARIGAHTKGFIDGIKNAEGATGKFKAAVGALGPLIAGIGFTLLGRNALQAGERITNLSNQLNTNAEALQALQFATNETGASQGALERALRNVQIRTQQAIDGNDQYAKAFERLGINIDEFNKLPTEQKMQKIAVASRNATDQQAAYADVARILGERAGPELQGVLDELATKGFDGVSNAAKQAGQVMSEDTARALANASDAIDRLKNTMTIVVGEIISKVTPAFEMLSNFITRNKNAVTFLVGGLVTFYGMLKTTQVALAGYTAAKGLATVATGAFTAAKTKAVAAVSALNLALVKNPFVALAAAAGAAGYAIGTVIDRTFGLSERIGKLYDAWDNFRSVAIEGGDEVAFAMETAIQRAETLEQKEAAISEARQEAIRLQQAGLEALQDGNRRLANAYAEQASNMFAIVAEAQKALPPLESIKKTTLNTSENIESAWNWLNQINDTMREARRLHEDAEKTRAKILATLREEIELADAKLRGDKEAVKQIEKQQAIRQEVNRIMRMGLDNEEEALIIAKHIVDQKDRLNRLGERGIEITSNKNRLERIALDIAELQEMKQRAKIQNDHVMLGLINDRIAELQNEQREIELLEAGMQLYNAEGDEAKKLIEERIKLLGKEKEAVEEVTGAAQERVKAERTVTESTRARTGSAAGAGAQAGGGQSSQQGGGGNIAGVFSDEITRLNWQIMALRHRIRNPRARHSGTDGIPEHRLGVALAIAEARLHAAKEAAERRAAGLEPLHQHNVRRDLYGRTLSEALAAGFKAPAVQDIVDNKGIIGGLKTINQSLQGKFVNQ